MTAGERVDDSHGDVPASPEPEPGPALPPRRRGRTRLGTAAAVVALVALVIGGVAFDRAVLSAEPLQRGSWYGMGDEHRVMRPPGGPDALIYRYRPGATFRHRFDVVNGGDLPIRVLDLPQPIDRLAYAELVSVETGDGGKNEFYGGAPDRWIPMAPFALTPGEHRMISFTYRFRKCAAPPLFDDSPRELFNGGVSWDDLPVRIEILGVDREYAMPLGHTVGLEGVSGDCESVPTG